MRHLKQCKILRQLLYSGKGASVCTNTITRCINNISPSVAIVGSGPAGFYTAQQILKGHPSVQVDIYEKLPVPFGLVRFGVAPDHPDVKNVINTFSTTAGNERCTFLGNVDIGKDVSVTQLKEAYSAVVMAYGADNDKQFGISGEHLNGVVSARNFVGWYNGFPKDRHLNPNLDHEVAVVLGQGNVAIDVARILLTPVDELLQTDITDYALEALSKSRIKRVYLVGRRGPLQVAFTTAELRELLRLTDTKTVLQKEDFLNLEQSLIGMKRPRKRLTELLIKSALKPDDKDQIRWTEASREWVLKFLRSPSQFLEDSSGKNVCGVRLVVNKLQGNEPDQQTAIATDETEDIECGLVFRSIGYKSISIDDALPFDSYRGIIPNVQGRVEGHQNLYCSGWVKRGPVGVIVSTMNDAFETGHNIAADLKENKLIVTSTQQGKSDILKKLQDKGVHPVLFSNWENIDREEIRRGKTVGKLREKIVDIKDMLDIAKT